MVFLLFNEHIENEKFKAPQVSVIHMMHVIGGDLYTNCIIPTYIPYVRIYSWWSKSVINLKSFTDVNNKINFILITF